MVRSSYARLAGVAAATVLAVALVAPAFAACPHERTAPLQPQTSTFAGSGYPRVTDGPVKAAGFIDPFGIAVGPDGSIYVADGDAHDIRRIHNGVVDVFAGTAPDGLSVQQRIGGYRDGPVRTARFNRPTGVAVAKDGTVYVSDEANQMVRKISHGIVSTFAKNLAHPYGIAVDDDGNVYVADFGAGLDEFTPDGTRKVLSYSSEPTVCGVYARGAGKDRILAYTDFKGIHLVKGDAAKYVASTDDAEPGYNETHPIGPGCGIVAFDDNTVAISDDFDSAVRFVRFSVASPVGAPPMVRIISGGRKAGSLSIAGYRDGSAEVSELDQPRGLALERNGSILVADAGNRRIRTITGVDPRGSAGLNADGTVAVAEQPSGSYRVVVIGNSLTFANALWPDSIPGQIEQGLIRDRAAIGLRACPDVVAYRFSAGAISDIGSFLGTYYADHEADLIVFLIDTANVGKELATLHSRPEYPLGKTPEEIAGDWLEIQARLRKIRDTVSRGGAAFTLVALPDGRSISPLENTRRDQLPDSLLDFYSEVRPNFQTYRIALEYQRELAASGVKTIGLTAPMLHAEEGPIRVPLYNPQDYHPTIDGDILIGRLILAGLEQWKPWKVPAINR